MLGSSFPLVLLRYRDKIVGFGKVLFVNGAPSKKTHGHDLKDHAQPGEELVSVYHVQIFNEYVCLRYPYKFSSFEDPPLLLKDMNDQLKYFKCPIAWDKAQLVPNSRRDELADAPRMLPAPKSTLDAPTVSRGTQRTMKTPSRRHERTERRKTVTFADPVSRSSSQDFTSRTLLPKTQVGSSSRVPRPRAHVQYPVNLGKKTKPPSFYRFSRIPYNTNAAPFPSHTSKSGYDPARSSPPTTKPALSAQNAYQSGIPGQYQAPRQPAIPPGYTPSEWNSVSPSHRFVIRRKLRGQPLGRVDSAQPAEPLHRLDIEDLDSEAEAPEWTPQLEKHRSRSAGVKRKYLGMTHSPRGPSRKKRLMVREKKMVKECVAIDLHDERIDEGGAGRYTNLILNGGAGYTRGSSPAGTTVRREEMALVGSNFVDPNYGMILSHSPRNSLPGKPIRVPPRLGRQSSYMSEDDGSEDRRRGSDGEHSCPVRRGILFSRRGNRTASSCRELSVQFSDDDDFEDDGVAAPYRPFRAGTSESFHAESSEENGNSGLTDGAPDIVECEERELAKSDDTTSNGGDNSIETKDGSDTLEYGVLRDANEIEEDVVQEFSRLNNLFAGSATPGNQVSQGTAASCAEADAIALLRGSFQKRRKRTYTYRSRRKVVPDVSR